jgi:hypothetical protein
LRQWLLVVPPDETVEIAPADWADTLVVVISGELEVLCRSGCRARFATGAVLTLAGLSVFALSNPRPRPLVLQAVTRQSMTT